MTSVLSMLEALGREDVDVYDNTYDDFGDAWGTWDDGEPAIAAVYRRIMGKTEYVTSVPEEYGVHFVADIAGFVKKNLRILSKFAREWNDEEWKIDGSEDGIWAGIVTVHALMIGNYPEEAYSWLARAWGLPLKGVA